MILQGTLINTAAIVIGTVAGSLLRKGIPEQYRTVLFDVIGISACGVGIHAVVRHMPQSQYPVLFIVALALGSLAGSALDLDGRFQRLIRRFGSSRLGEGLATAILLYCIGTLSILGPVKSALQNDNTFLYTNATLDLVTSLVLATSYGIGIILAAPVLFVWQGALYFGASGVAEYLNGPLMTEISLVGGFLIACSGLSVLKIKEFKTMNMLPSLLVPPLWFLLLGAWRMAAGA